MLTKLEVNGFKNLLDFSISFGPFNCIAGLNGVGKSNIFDAIKFISLLCDFTLVEAAMAVRGSKSADLLDIFWTNGEYTASKIKIAVEMIVPQNVTDDFGRSAIASSTFLRYELEIGREIIDKKNSSGSIYLISEQLFHIIKGDAPSKINFPLNVGKFRDQVILNNRRSVGFISTYEDRDVTAIRMHQEGKGGNPQSFPIINLHKTVVSNTNSNTWPTILAARREMQSWRFLSLEPTAMRESNRFYDYSSVRADGGGMASALVKLLEEDSNVLSRVSSRLSEIIPTTDIRIDTDEIRQLYTVEVKERSGAYLPARSLSDGTLRFLALCIMAEDPQFQGLLCFEEPENGIHPGKMQAMLSLLKDLAVNPFEPVSEINPMRQILIATHSPVLVSLEDRDDLIYADIVKIRGPDGKPASTVRCKSLRDSWRADQGGGVLEKASIISYLTLPVGAQISLI